MEVMLDQLRAEPLENTGLVAALKKLCESIGFRTGAQVEFKLGAAPPTGLSAPGAAEAILRVAQEALANVARHARASHVSELAIFLNDALHHWSFAPALAFVAVLAIGYYLKTYRRGRRLNQPVL